MMHLMKNESYIRKCSQAKDRHIFNHESHSHSLCGTNNEIRPKEVSGRNMLI